MITFRTLLFVVASLGAETVKGAVIVKSFGDPLVLFSSFGQIIEEVDINEDGLTDVSFGITSSGVSIRTERFNQIVVIPATPPNLGGIPSPLSDGFEIGFATLQPGYEWLSTDIIDGFVGPGEFSFVQLVQCVSTGCGGGFLLQRGHLGLEFEIAGETHYGYFDLEGGQNSTSILIHSWAYETEPGVPIFAGAVPEPSSVILICSSMALGLTRRRRNLLLAPKR